MCVRERSRGRSVCGLDMMAYRARDERRHFQAGQGTHLVRVRNGHGPVVYMWGHHCEPLGGAIRGPRRGQRVRD